MSIQPKECCNNIISDKSDEVLKNNIVPIHAHKSDFTSKIDFLNHVNGLYDHFEAALDKAGSPLEVQGVLKIFAPVFVQYLDHLAVGKIKDNLARICARYGLAKKLVEEVMDRAAANGRGRAALVFGSPEVRHFVDFDDDGMIPLHRLARSFAQETRTIHCRDGNVILAAGDTARAYGAGDYEQWLVDLRSIDRLYFNFHHHKPKELFKALFNGHFTESYDMVSDYPVHTYDRNLRIYAAKSYPAPAGRKHIAKILDFFPNFATEGDRGLFVCAMAQPMLCSMGRSPMVVVTADNLSCGKTTLVDTIARIYGSPPVSMPLGEKEWFMARRLLSQTSAKSRIISIDNVKSPADNAYLEKLITDTHISGENNRRRNVESVNKYTFFMTCNLPSLSRDVAQRAMVIHLKKPAYSGGWKEALEEYIDGHRLEILGEIDALLGEPGNLELQYGGRFPQYYKKVLFKVFDSQEALDELQKVQEERMDAYDSQRDAEVLVHEVLRDLLQRPDAADETTEDGNTLYFSYWGMAAHLAEYRIIPKKSIHEMKMCLDPLSRNELKGIIKLVKVNGKNRVKLNVEELLGHRP